jgi:hypothetical protein
MGDIAAMKSIVAELKQQSAAFLPFCNDVIRLAGDFDFDGIIEMVKKLED